MAHATPFGGGGLGGRILRRPRLRWLPPAILVVILLLLAAQLTGTLAKAAQLTGLGAASPTFQTSKVTSGNIAVNVVATGPVTPINQLPLNFQSSGVLSELDAKVGDTVHKGQVLARLDPTNLQNALDQARATLAQQQANLANLENSATPQQKAVAQASVNSAQTTLANDQKSLTATRSTTTQSVAAAQASLSAAQATEATGLAADQLAVTNAQKNLDAVKATVATNPGIRAQAVQQAKDSLWSAQISRDATCGRGTGPNCDAANATVAAQETAVNNAEAQLAQGQAQDSQTLQTAQASLSQAQSQLSNDQSKLGSALESARVALAQAQAQANASIQSAQSQVSSASDAVKTAQANYAQTVAPPTQASLDAAKAQVANAQAAVTQAQSNLNGATLLAPFDGTVSVVNGTVGQDVAGGPTNANSSPSTTTTVTAAQGIVTLTSLNDLEVSAQVNEADVGKVKVGDPVTFTVNAYPTQKLTGKVLNIQPVSTTSQNVVDYDVVSSIQSTPGATLYPGMTATATITTNRADNTLMVPNTAITFAQTAIRSGLLGNRAGSGSSQGAGRSAGVANGQGSSRQGSGQPARAGVGSDTTPGASASAGASSANGQQNTGRGVVMTLQNGKLAPVPVTLGMTDGTSTQVLSGLQEGEAIVVGEVGGSAPNTAGASAGQSGNAARPAGGGLFGGGAGGFRG